MDINKKNLEKEFLKILRNYYKIKSLSNYKENYASYTLMQNLFYNLYGIDIDYDYDNVFCNIKPKETTLDYYFNEFNKDYFYNQKLLKKVLDTYTRVNFYNIPNFKFNKLKESEYKDIIRDFLYSYDDKLGTLFDKTVSNELISTNNSLLSDYGLSYSFKTSDNDYVLIKSSYNIESAITLVHEIGHLYQSKLIKERNGNQYYNIEKSFIELFPTYLERIFNKYLINNHIYLKDSLLCENSFLFNLRLFAFDFLDMYDFDDYVDFDDYDKQEIHECMSYFFALYLTVLLEDKDIKDTFNDYVCYSGLLNREEELKFLGIDKDEMIKSNKLKKVLVKHNTNINKYKVNINGNK